MRTRLGGEFESAGGSVPLQALMLGTVLENRQGALGHPGHIPDRYERARLAVRDDLRDAARGARDDRDATRHRLERRETKRLGG